MGACAGQEAIMTQKTGATNLMLDPLHALRDGHQICRHTKHRLPFVLLWHPNGCYRKGKGPHCMGLRIQPITYPWIYPWGYLDLHPSARMRMLPGLGTRHMWLIFRLVHCWSPGSLSSRRADTRQIPVNGDHSKQTAASLLQHKLTFRRVGRHLRRSHLPDLRPDLPEEQAVMSRTSTSPVPAADCIVTKQFLFL